jgi:hypothetical protein
MRRQHVFSNVADPGSGAFLTLGSEIRVGKNRIRIRDDKPGSYFRELRNQPIVWDRIFKLFDGDPGSAMEKIRIRDPG